MAHDFKNFPELTNQQMQFYYWESPHKQIREDFDARVIVVHDGDTITVRWSERDFDFPIRFNNIASPELNENGGHEAQKWLENILLGEEIKIKIDPNKAVGKFGRLLGGVFHKGLDVGEEEIFVGLAKPFANKNEGKIISPIKLPNELK